MRILDPLKRFIVSNAGRTGSLAVVVALGTMATAWLLVYGGRSPAASENTPAASENTSTRSAADRSVPTSDEPDAASSVGAGSLLQIPSARLGSLRIETQPARRHVWPQRLRVTGRLELNQSKEAHVSPLVSGVVRKVCVELGQEVRAGDTLAYIDSREVGAAKLNLVKCRSDLEFAEKTHQWYKTVHDNTTALLATLKQGCTINDVEEQFRDRPLGSYRQQLISSLAQLEHARANNQRIRSLGETVVPRKEVVRIVAEHKSAEATYQALVEQIKFDTQRELLLSQRQLQEAEAAVAIGRAELLILGFTAKDIEAMDPLGEAQRVAYYPVRTPIDGTVIAKHVSFSRHVDADTEFIDVADLSTVWLRADVFEKDLGALHGFRDKTVRFRTSSYPRREFAATVFSLGDLVDDQTRAVRLLAVAENPRGLLKPGMFVEIDLDVGHDHDVLQVPASAIQRHQHETFVFLQQGEGEFACRNVRIGRTTPERVEITAGLTESDLVVVRGGFALKSEMLSELMVEE